MEFSLLKDAPLFLAFVGAAIAAIGGGVGSALGSGTVGRAATGLAAEKPELGMKAVILEALPGSQAIYGFVVLFFVLFVVLTPEKKATFDATQGLQVMMACFPVAITGWLSAVAQGKVLAASMNMIAKHEATFGQAMIMGAIVETVAILGLLGSILMLLNI